MTGLEKVAEYQKNNPTKSERLFAERLRRAGLKFETQTIICGYLPDFYFPERNRIVELDGRFHRDRKEHDQRRDAKLRSAGYEVLRLKSATVFHCCDWAVNKVLEFLGRPLLPVSRTVRKKRKKARTISKGSPAWAKVPRLTKDHLPSRRKG